MDGCGGTSGKGLFVSLVRVSALFGIVFFRLLFNFLHYRGNGPFHMFFRIGRVEEFRVGL